MLGFHIIVKADEEVPGDPSIASWNVGVFGIGWLRDDDVRSKLIAHNGGYPLEFRAKGSLIAEHAPEGEFDAETWYRLDAWDQS